MAFAFFLTILLLSSGIYATDDTTNATNTPTEQVNVHETQPRDGNGYGTDNYGSTNTPSEQENVYPTPPADLMPKGDYSSGSGNSGNSGYGSDNYGSDVMHNSNYGTDETSVPSIPSNVYNLLFYVFQLFIYF